MMPELWLKDRAEAIQQLMEATNGWYNSKDTDVIAEQLELLVDDAQKELRAENEAMRGALEKIKEYETADVPPHIALVNVLMHADLALQKAEKG